MVKKFIKYWLFTFLSIWFISSFCFWIWELWDNGLDSSFPYKSEHTDALECDNTNLWDCTSIKEDEKKPVEDTIIRRLLKVFGLKEDKYDNLKFIDYAKAIINIALTLTAFIALIMTLYTFYMVIFSESEAGIKKAKWNLVGIFVALAIIWLAWLIVSFIFRWYRTNWFDRNKDEDIEEITMVNYELNDWIYFTI